MSEAGVAFARADRGCVAQPTQAKELLGRELQANVAIERELFVGDGAVHELGVKTRDEPGTTKRHLELAKAQVQVTDLVKLHKDVVND